MYFLRKEYCDFFKEYRTNLYASYLDCDAGFMSTVLNSNKMCSTVVAKSLIGVRFDISIKDPMMNEYLEKYFVKEK